MSRAVCKNRITGEEMDELLCNSSIKPPAKIVDCNDNPCSTRWSIDEWGPCSATCGNGIKNRNVYCSEKINFTSITVSFFWI